MQLKSNKMNMKIYVVFDFIVFLKRFQSNIYGDEKKSNHIKLFKY